MGVSYAVAPLWGPHLKYHLWIINVRFFVEGKNFLDFLCCTFNSQEPSSPSSFLELSHYLNESLADICRWMCSVETEKICSEHSFDGRRSGFKNKGFWAPRVTCRGSAIWAGEHSQPLWKKNRGEKLFCFKTNRRMFHKWHLQGTGGGDAGLEIYLESLRSPWFVMYLIIPVMGLSKKLLGDTCCSLRGKK